MPLFPLPIEEFGGLNLVDAPDEIGFSGAVDMLNVDLLPGIQRSRSGYATKTAFAVPAADTSPLRLVRSFYGPQGSPYDRLLLVVHNDGHAAMLGSNGAGVTDSVASLVATDAVRSHGGENVFVCMGTTGKIVYAIDASPPTAAAFTTSPLNVSPLLMCAQPWDVRTMYLNNSGHTSRVYWSDPGLSATVQTNNFVDFEPNDEAGISGKAVWGNQVFVFKPTKFFVVYGTSQDGSGNPIFNFRTVDTGIGCSVYETSRTYALQGVAAGPEGVFFVNRRGIYRTTGGIPQLFSEPLDPIFTGTGMPAFFNGSALNQSKMHLCVLHYQEEKLYFAYPSGASTTNDRVFVYDFRHQTWTQWDVPITSMASWHPTDREELWFAQPSSQYAQQMLSSYTQDGGDGLTTGTPITSRYQSGFDNIAPPRRFAAHYLFGNTRKRLRKWKITGTGNVSFSTAHDFGSPGTATSLTLGASPAITDGWHNIASRGQLFSYKFSGTSPWTVQKMTAYLAGSEPPLLGNPSDAS